MSGFDLLNLHIHLTFYQSKKWGALQLQKRYNKEQENKPIPVSREDLAGIVGTSTESVIRTLSDFKDEKLIDINGRNISIINPEKLKKVW